MKYFLCFLVTLSTYVSYSQTFNKWSVDANIGVNSALGPFAEGYQSNFLGIYHADANIRYTLSNKFGVMWGLGFDRIKHDEMGQYQDSKYFKVHYIRTSLQAVFNLGRMADFQLLNDRVGLLLHGGFGFASLKNAHYSVWFKDWKTQGSDEMMHVLIGLTPQVRLTDYLAVHMDFTYVGNIWQTKTFDFTTPNTFHKGVDGRLVSFSVGASYYFGKDGKGKKHLDWIYTNPDGTVINGYSPGDTIIERETIRTIERVRVVGDGDAKNGGEEGSQGDSGNELKDKDQSLHGPDDDFDGDGVPNRLDSCPTTPGEDPNGCPNSDRDGDGIVNSDDKCPDIKGAVEFGGCPPIDLEVERILNEAMRTVDFNEGNDDLLEESYPALDKLVNVLGDHKEYMLDIEGHTDNSGEPAPNMSLSKARAEKVKAYLVSKGIDSSRLFAEGYGETKPIASNNDPAGRRQNERIEFKIKFQ